MNTSINEAGKEEGAGGKVRVPVHEDYLFDVDVLERELAPVSLIFLSSIFLILLQKEYTATFGTFCVKGHFEEV